MFGRLTGLVFDFANLDKLFSFQLQFYPIILSHNICYLSNIYNLRHAKFNSYA
jgi:hypothetical protein